MEAATVTSPPLSLHHHCFPPNTRIAATISNNCNNHLQTFKRKAFSSRQKRKTPIFEENDAFPDSLPLHTKNPHAIYKVI
ncbi:hypothetical protein TB2_027383 [Malus domestica]